MDQDVPKERFPNTWGSEQNYVDVIFLRKKKKIIKHNFWSGEKKSEMFKSENFRKKLFQLRRPWVSLACFRETGPWPDNVYCIQGKSAHPLDDGDSFLAWCFSFLFPNKV